MPLVQWEDEDLVVLRVVEEYGDWPDAFITDAGMAKAEEKSNPFVWQTRWAGSVTTRRWL